MILAHRGKGHWGGDGKRGPPWRDHRWHDDRHGEREGEQQGPESWQQEWEEEYGKELKEYERQEHEARKSNDDER